MEFAWDERKNRINKQKHGLSFETARLVFDDPHHLTRQDREVDGEPRWQTIGIVNGVHILLVAHTVDEDEEVICRCSKIMSPLNCNETLSPCKDGDDESERVPAGESD